MKEALRLERRLIVLALVFNLGLYFLWDRIYPESPYTNSEAGLAFLTGYLVEKALSVDNIFVFLMVFTYFNVPAPSTSTACCPGDRRCAVVPGAVHRRRGGVAAKLRGRS